MARAIQCSTWNQANGQQKRDWGPRGALPIVANEHRARSRAQHRGLTSHSRRTGQRGRGHPSDPSRRRGAGGSASVSEMRPGSALATAPHAGPERLRQHPTPRSLPHRANAIIHRSRTLSTRLVDGGRRSGRASMETRCPPTPPRTRPHSAVNASQIVMPPARIAIGSLSPRPAKRRAPQSPALQTERCE